MIVRTCVSLVVGCALVMPIVGQGAQTAVPTVDQILARNIEAVGGRAALEKLTTITAKGTISVPDAGIEGTIELYQKAPDKSLTIVNLGGMEQRQGFDGTTGWSSDPQNGLRELAGAELAEVKLSSAFGRELRMKELYKTLTVKGREKLGANDVYVVEAVPASGTPTQLYYDVNSGLIVQQRATRQTAIGPLDLEVGMDDYRAVDGVKRPFRIRQTTSQFSAVVQLKEITHNAPIDDAMFRKPK